MLAFLHGAASNVELFQGLVRELDSEVPVRHAVRDDLLSAALKAGSIDGVAPRIAEAVEALVGDGASVVVCTCTTLAPAAETAPVSGRALVTRVDRAMAEQAVAADRRLLLVTTLETALETTLALLRSVATASARALDVEGVVCAGAWRRFERGEQAEFVREIAATAAERARPGDLVLLAQSSMLVAAGALSALGVDVLTTPPLAVHAALAAHRERSARAAPSP